MTFTRSQIVEFCKIKMQVYSEAGVVKNVRLEIQVPFECRVQFYLRKCGRAYDATCKFIFSILKTIVMVICMSAQIAAVIAAVI